jgi:YidC/Oxa1 family membrane protein insertase
MEQARLLIALALSFLVILVWQFFFVDREVKKTPAPETTQEQSTDSDQPTVSAPTPAEPETVVTAADDPVQAATTGTAETLTVDTPLYRVAINGQGASFTSFVLKNYREAVEKDAPLKELIRQKPALATVTTGFAGNSVDRLEKAVFTANAGAPELTVTDIDQEVVFSHTNASGVTIEKRYRFSPKSYVIGMDVTVINRSGQAILDSLVVNLNSDAPAKKRVYGFIGPSVMIDENVEEIAVKELDEKNSFSGSIKWVALQDRYFMSSLAPQQAQPAAVKLALLSDNVLQSQFIQPQQNFSPGTRFSYSYDLFFGPKSTQLLDTIGHDLKKSVNFGWFDFLARPCLWIMNKIHAVIPNYGVAIILLTLLIKIVLWPLGTKSYKSMNEMKKIQPLMQEIREKYKNDKKRMNEEVMALYRAYKVNPVGGCLPMLVQLPIFFALYRMLYQAIELRHAPFFGWIKDLSAPDRLFQFDFAIPFMEAPYGIPVLTLVMGATMLLQQKMSPPMGDPAQAKMMMLMPVVFTFIFINFSSGLVLYWLINNVLSIGQQYYIQKKFA